MHRFPLRSLVVPAILVSVAILGRPDNARAQKFVANYDETKIPAFELPDPLKRVSGKRVKTAKQWTKKRRPEVLRLFQEHVYGKAPGRPPKMVSG